ncbi:MAG TPA: hypothetical protein VNZ26_12010, partial [Vicinamibacterales bacterium]|nr:hypothetical protein [Vicinamibacterales bacterium]
MTRTIRSFSFIGLSVLLIGLFQGRSTRAAAGLVIRISNLTDLYMAVNDPANAGARLELQPEGSPYYLDISQPNGGRLELQPDMELAGTPGDAGAVVIDGSVLTSDSTGAIRIGRGNNVIEWLTVQNSTRTNAGINTDLAPTTGVNAVRIAHAILKGNVRGIDFRVSGTPANGHVLEGTFEENLF